MPLWSLPIGCSIPPTMGNLKTPYHFERCGRGFEGGKKKFNFFQLPPCKANEDLLYYAASAGHREPNPNGRFG